MGLFDRFRAKAVETPPEVKEEIDTPPQPTAVSVVVYDSISNAFINSWLGSSSSYLRYATDKESGNATVASIVQRISGAVAEMLDQGVEVVGADGEVSTSKDAERIINQLRDPNEAETSGDFIRNIAMSLLLQGEAFIHAPYVEGVGIEVMTVMQADLVQVNQETTDKYKVRSYSYDGKTYEPDVVIHIKLPNPDKSTLRGLSPLAPIVKQLELGTTIVAQTQKLVSQGGAKNLISLAQMPDVNMASVVDQLTNSINSKDAKRNEIEAIPLSVHKLGDTAADLTLLELSNAINLAVCSVYNFPPNLLTADSTFSNLAEAKKYVYTISRTYLDAILNGFRRQFKMRELGLRFRFNPDKIEEMRPRRKDIYDALKDAITTNEQRALYNYPEIAGGDEVLTAMNRVPLSAVTTPMTITEEGEK